MKNPFGNGMGGDGKMTNGGRDFGKTPVAAGQGGNDFTTNPSPQSPQGGNDFTKNPGGFTGKTPSASPCAPDPNSIPAGGRSVFPAKPSGEGKVPTPGFRLKK